MSRYVLKFHKTGYVKYTSHLDLLRIFKRSFKKCGLALRYSQGFNPHPKMGFAQPLSLGYSSLCELIEFETAADHDPNEILKKMQDTLPEGLEPVSCQRFDQNIKSLAGEADSAVYTVWIPVPPEAADQWTSEIAETTAESYLSQNEITAMKRQKKTKKLSEKVLRFSGKSNIMQWMSAKGMKRQIAHWPVRELSRTMSANRTTAQESVMQGNSQASRT